MNERHVNEGARIVVLPSARYVAQDKAHSEAIQKQIRDLLLKSMETYRKVLVSVKHGRDGGPEALIAYMHRAHSYTLDIARLGIGSDYTTRSVDLSYAEVEQETTVWPTTPIGKTQMVFATPVPEITTAKAAVEFLYALGTKLGYKCVKLVGKSANKANYIKYLAGHLLVFVNIGHGNTQGIALSDGFLPYTVLQSVPKDALWPEVIYLNSCQVFNPPLQPAIMAHGARTFIGGKVNLLIGASEEVCKCFWTKVIRGLTTMRVALVTCEKQKYPTPGCHGISGDLGKFKPFPKSIPIP